MERRNLCGFSLSREFTDERAERKFCSRELNSGPVERERVKQATSANNAIRFKSFP